MFHLQLALLPRMFGTGTQCFWSIPRHITSIFIHTIVLENLKTIQEASRVLKILILSNLTCHWSLSTYWSIGATALSLPFLKTIIFFPKNPTFGKLYEAPRTKAMKHCLQLFPQIILSIMKLLVHFYLHSRRKEEKYHSECWRSIFSGKIHFACEIQIICMQR